MNAYYVIAALLVMIALFSLMMQLVNVALPVAF